LLLNLASSISWLKVSCRSVLASKLEMSKVGRHDAVVFSSCYGNCGTLHEAVQEYRSTPRRFIVEMWPCHDIERCWMLRGALPTSIRERQLL